MTEIAISLDLLGFTIASHSHMGMAMGKAFYSIAKWKRLFTDYLPLKNGVISFSKSVRADAIAMCISKYW